jgi:hypothetical protein
MDWKEVRAMTMSSLKEMGLILVVSLVASVTVGGSILALFLLVR